MNEVKGRCKKHGELNEQNAFLCKDSNVPSGYRWRCKVCRYENRVVKYYRDREENIRKSVEWGKNNKERKNENERNRRLKDIDATRAKERAARQRRLDKDPDSVRIKAICASKKVSLDQYYKMTEDQKGLCAICGKEESRKNRTGEISKRLSIDHCHESGKIRGLLCHDCNTGIGKFKDSVELLTNAVNYLKKHKD